MPNRLNFLIAKSIREELFICMSAFGILLVIGFILCPFPAASIIPIIVDSILFVGSGSLYQLNKYLIQVSPNNSKL